MIAPTYIRYNYVSLDSVWVRVRLSSPLFSYILAPTVNDSEVGHHQTLRLCGVKSAVHVRRQSVIRGVGEGRNVIEGK